MAQFCIEIADSQVSGVMEAMGGQFNYQEQISNPDFDSSQAVDESTNPLTIDNTETLNQFVNRMVREWVINNVTAYNAKQAAITARQDAIDSTSLDITDPQL